MFHSSSEKLILALDGMDKSAALDFIEQLPDLSWVKVGLELFVSSGPDVIFDLKERGLKVFLDLKFHDIPITMSGACRQAAKYGAELITVHACAGINAMQEANAAAAEGAAAFGLPAPTLLGVTVLTSWESRKFSTQLNIDQPIEKRVEMLAKLSSEAGIGGCVCSPKEVKLLRNLFAETFELVTPGVRGKGLKTGDQARVMTPSEAIKAGASRLVVGRPITHSNEPKLAFENLCRELESPYLD